MSVPSTTSETTTRFSLPFNLTAPARYLLTLALLIFLAEAVTMGILFYLEVPNYLLFTLLDSIILSVLILPGLYLLQLKPILANSNAERKQRELAERLMQATAVLNTSLELEQVLQTILTEMRAVFPFQAADILLRHGETLQVAAVAGYEAYPGSQPRLEAPTDLAQAPLLSYIYKSQEPIIINSVADYAGWPVEPGQEWVCSFGAIPLIAEGQVIGNINIRFDRPYRFTADSVQLLLTFAVPAAVALDNARLYQSESNSRLIAETLSTAAQTFSQTLHLDKVIVALLDHLYNIIPFDSAGVTLLDEHVYPVMHTLRGYGQWENWDEIPTLPVDGDVITSSVIRRLESAQRSLVIPNLAVESADQKMPIQSWLVVPIMTGDKFIGWVELGKTDHESFNQERIQWVEAQVFQAGVALQNALLFEQVQTNRERLQSLAHKLVEIQETERRYIARELHDEAGQALSSLKIGFNLLAQSPDCSPRFKQQLDEMKGKTDTVLEELHRLAVNLRPSSLDHLGLVAALEQHMHKLSLDNLAIQFKAVGFDGVRLDKDVETSLFRIVQESLTNVIRHAQAQNVGVLLERRGNKVTLFVEDDGIGVSKAAIKKNEQLGLVGMQERAEMVGGTLTIESSPEIGTAIIVEVANACADSNH